MQRVVQAARLWRVFWYHSRGIPCVPATPLRASPRSWCPHQTTLPGCLFPSSRCLPSHRSCVGVPGVHRHTNHTPPRFAVLVTQAHRWALPSAVVHSHIRPSRRRTTSVLRSHTRITAIARSWSRGSLTPPPPVQHKTPTSIKFKKNIKNKKTLRPFSSSQDRLP